MTPEPSDDKNFEEKTKYILEKRMTDVVDVLESLISAASDKSRCNTHIAAETLSSAEIFLQRAKLLYANKDYAGTIHCIQQSCELMSKSFGSGLTGMDYSKHTKISHKTPLVFTELVKDKSISKFVEFAKSVNPELKTDTEPLEKLTKDESKKDEIRNLSLEQINAGLSLCDNVGEALRKNGNALSKEFGFEYVLSDVVSITVNLCKLYWIGAITFPHETTSRYPDKKTKPWDYTEDMGVVKAIPAFIKVLENSHEDIHSLIQLGDLIGKGLSVDENGSTNELNKAKFNETETGIHNVEDKNNLENAGVKV